MFWLKFRSPLFQPAGDGDGGGGAGDGGNAPADKGEGGEDQTKANGGDEPLTKAALQELFKASGLDGIGEWRRKINQELKAVRLGGKGGAGDGEERPKPPETPAAITMEDLKAERAYSKALGKLGALGLSDEQIQGLEDDLEDLPLAARTRALEVALKSRELLGETTKGKGREAGHRKGGGDGAPAGGNISHPATWKELIELKARDPKAYAELLKDKTFSLVQLRQRTEASSMR